MDKLTTDQLLHSWRWSSLVLSAVAFCTSSCIGCALICRLLRICAVFKASRQRNRTPDSSTKRLSPFAAPLLATKNPKRAGDPRPPHTRQKYEQNSDQIMTPNASKQGNFCLVLKGVGVAKLWPQMLQNKANSTVLGPSVCSYLCLVCVWGVGVAPLLATKKVDLGEGDATLRWSLKALKVIPSNAIGKPNKVGLHALLCGPKAHYLVSPILLPLAICDFSLAGQGKWPFWSVSSESGHLPRIAWKRSHIARGRGLGLTS